MKNKKILSITIATTSALLVASFLLPLAATAQDASLPNPLGLEGRDMVTILLRILQVILAIVDIFALFMFILGGFEFLVSAGNPNMIKRAKDTLVWATLGILVITLSYTILKFVFEEIQKGLG